MASSSPLGVFADEHALVARIRDGDAGAFDTLVVQQFDRMTRFASVVLGSDEGAEDVVQEILTRIWRNRAAWVLTTSLQAYLFTAVRRGALNRLRHDRFQARIGDAFHRELISDDAIAVPSGDDALALRVELAAVINRLPPRRRQAVLLRYAEGLSYPRVAEILGISTKGAEQLVMRTLRTLREHLMRMR